MPIFTADLPLSLYIHLPWCVKKCPYCDFNSHEAKEDIPEDLYVAALLSDLDSQLMFIKDRPLVSIFFGGGTPSLFSSRAVDAILKGVHARLAFSSAIEITLEANPGTVEAKRFAGFRNAGINRLSMGIQSFQDDKLKSLGRIHSSQEAKTAIQIAKSAGFSNFNLDVMYGLPQQTIDDALDDIASALSFSPTHFSWYQLTLEPNTFFHHQPPTLPTDETIWEMQLAGQTLLHKKNFQQYEVSAYARENLFCKHNINYWEFGDYLGIGAGAHSKITRTETQEVFRFAQVRHPKDYLNAEKRAQYAKNKINDKELMFEFMLNALRLTQGVSKNIFIERTGVSISAIENILLDATQKKLLHVDNESIRPTEHGRNYLNDLVSMFL